VPATKAVVKQSAQALRIDRFMFTLLANFVKPHGIEDTAGLSRSRRGNILRDGLTASGSRIFYRMECRTVKKGEG